MFLSDTDIKKALDKGDLTIKDFDQARLNPASYDILLANKFIITLSHKTTMIDPAKKIYPETEEVALAKDEHFVLYPGGSVLGTSVDYFGSDKYLIHLSGKSSLARLGLVIHNTACIVNPGHFLNIVFELANLNSVPIVLRPNMRIAQILFSTLSSTPMTDYKKTGRYNEDNWKTHASAKEENKKLFDI